MDKLLLLTTELSLGAMWAAAVAQKLRVPRGFLLELGRLGPPLSALPVVGGLAVSWEAALGTLSLSGNAVALPLSAVLLLAYTAAAGTGPCRCLPGPGWLNRWPKRRNLVAAGAAVGIYLLTADPSWRLGLIPSLSAAGASATAFAISVARLQRELRRPSSAFVPEPTPSGPMGPSGDELRV